MFLHHIPDLFSYAIDKITDAVTESFNSKVQMIKLPHGASTPSRTTASPLSSTAENSIYTHNNLRRANFMNAIVTVAIGRSLEIYNETNLNLKSYAQQCDCAFVCLQEARTRAPDAKFEKLQIYNLLEKYERIIYLDADILVHPTCPNLLEITPTETFCAYFDSNGGNGDAETFESDLIRADEISDYQRMNGHISWEKTYFNSGVMVVGKNHREMFNYNRPLVRGKRFVDQTFLNYRLQELRLQWFDIGQTFNHFVALNRSQRLYETRFHSNILHYAGFNEFYPERNLVEQLKSDKLHLEVIRSSL